MHQWSSAVGGPEPPKHGTSCRILYSKTKRGLASTQRPSTTCLTLYTCSYIYTQKTSFIPKYHVLYPLPPAHSLICHFSLPFTSSSAPFLPHNQSVSSFPFPFTLLTKNSPAVRLSVSAVWTENSTQGMVLSVIRDMFLVHCSMRSACVVNTSTVSPAVSAIRAYVPEQIWVQEGNKGRISSDKHTFIYTI